MDHTLLYRALGKDHVRGAVVTDAEEVETKGRHHQQALRLLSLAVLHHGTLQHK